MWQDPPRVRAAFTDTLGKAGLAAYLRSMERSDVPGHFSALTDAEALVAACESDRDLAHAELRQARAECPKMPESRALNADQGRAWRAAQAASSAAVRTDSALDTARRRLARQRERFEQATAPLPPGQTTVLACPASIATAEADGEAAIMARAKPDGAGGLCVAVESINFHHAGQSVYIGPGAVFRAGNPVMRGRERFFRPLVLSHDAALPLQQVSVAVAGAGDDSAGEAIRWQWLNVRIPSPDPDQSPA